MLKKRGEEKDCRLSRVPNCDGNPLTSGLRFGDERAETKGGYGDCRSVGDAAGVLGSGGPSAECLELLDSEGSQVGIFVAPIRMNPGSIDTTGR